MSNEKILCEVFQNIGWKLDEKQKVWCFEKLRIPIEAIKRANYEYDGKFELVRDHMISKLQFAKHHEMVSKTITALKNVTILGA